MKQNIRIQFKKLFKKPTELFNNFHIKTKIKRFPLKVPIEDWPKEWTNVYFKSYARAPAFPLPKVKKIKVPFDEVLKKRQSTRHFSTEPIDVESLSTLMYFSCGIRKQSTHWKANRFYPSGGSRYPLEVYIISLNTVVEKGIYHYYVKNHLLERIGPVNTNSLIKLFNQDWIQKSGCVIVITAVFRRNTVKYGNRGYRHILIEAGHMAQNIYLTTSALNLKCCSIGGYKDEKLEKLIDINGIDESVVYCLAVGK